MDRTTAAELALAHGGDRVEDWIELLLLGAKIGAEEEREACAKQLDERASMFRKKDFPHIYEEKAQLVEYCANLLRGNAACKADGGLPTVAP